MHNSDQPSNFPHKGKFENGFKSDQPSNPNPNLIPNPNPDPNPNASVNFRDEK